MAGSTQTTVLSAALAQCWLLQQQPGLVTSQVPSLCLCSCWLRRWLQPDLCWGCWGLASCKLAKSTPAAIAWGPSPLRGRTTWATPPRAFHRAGQHICSCGGGTSQSHSVADLQCNTGLVGFPDEGLGTRKLLSADLGLSQGIHF